MAKDTAHRTLDTGHPTNLVCLDSVAGSALTQNLFYYLLMFAIWARAANFKIVERVRHTHTQPQYPFKG